MSPTGPLQLLAVDHLLTDEEPAVTSALMLDIERWFVRRGVPQLIEGYSTEARMDARATPWIAAWLVIGTILFWGTRPDWPIAANVAGIAQFGRAEAISDDEWERVLATMSLPRLRRFLVDPGERARADRVS